MCAVASARPPRRSFAFRESPKLSVSAELVDRAFRLASFLRPDLEAACRVTATALAFLDEAFERQNRRSSYRPQRSRTKAQKNRAQCLANPETTQVAGWPRPSVAMA